MPFENCDFLLSKSFFFHTMKVNGYQRFSIKNDLKSAGNANPPYFLNSCSYCERFILVTNFFLPFNLIKMLYLDLPIKRTFLSVAVSDFSNHFVCINPAPFLQHSSSIQATTSAQKKKIRLNFHYIAT